MAANEELIPRPKAVRDRLARNLREARLLRRQLRVSVAAAEDRVQEHAQSAPENAEGEGRGE